MTKTISTIFTIVAMIMLVDSISFVGWAASGQKPVDNFYAGAITANILASIEK